LVARSCCLPQATPGLRRCRAPCSPRDRSRGWELSPTDGICGTCR
jgi:hypothetical protein